MFSCESVRRSISENAYRTFESGVSFLSRLATYFYKPPQMNENEIYAKNLLNAEKLSQGRISTVSFKYNIVISESGQTYNLEKLLKPIENTLFARDIKATIDSSKNTALVLGFLSLGPLLCRIASVFGRS